LTILDYMGLPEHIQRQKQRIKELVAELHRFLGELKSTQHDLRPQKAKEGLKLAQELYMRCLEHLEDDTKLLSEVERLLKAYRPGGIQDFQKSYGNFEQMEKRLDIKLLHLSELIRNQILIFTAQHGYSGYGQDLNPLIGYLNGIEQVVDSE